MNLRQTLSYIAWYNETDPVVLTAYEWHKKYLEIKENGQPTKTKTCRYDFYAIADTDKIAYKVEIKGKYRQLYTYDHENGYKWYTTNDFDQSKDGKSGTDAIRRFNAEFAKDYGKDETDAAAFRRNFGTTDKSFKACVPRQFYYINRSECNRTLHGISSIDDTAHYPSSACGPLPDSKTAVQYQGQVEPTEEYPFAFYLKSGHIKEFGKFDTREWLNSSYSINLFYFKQEDHDPYLAPEEDVTVLMKPAKYTLDSIWRRLYETRKTDPSAKLAMNATIGNWHRNKYTSHKYAHLAAITIGRANAKMLKAALAIGEDRILHICVDGIIYCGDAVAYNKKEFGQFQQEFTNCKFKMLGTNVYMAFDEDNKLVKWKHGAYNQNADGSNIEDCPPTKFEDMRQWKRVDILEEDI